MPYLRGSLAKECLVSFSTSEKYAGIRCYIKKVSKEYLSEGAKAITVTTGSLIGSAAVSTVIGLSTAVIGSATKCVINPPKSYVGGVLCIAGTLLSSCGVLPSPAALYCATAAIISFYGASKL